MLAVAESCWLAAHAAWNLPISTPSDQFVCVYICVYVCVSVCECMCLSTMQRVSV